MKRSLFSLLAIMVALVAAGCASEKKSSGPKNPPPVVDIPDGPFVPPGSGPGQGPGKGWEFGGTTTLSIVSLDVMSEYTGRVMNNPQNIRLNLNLTPQGKVTWGGIAYEAYGGTATISYTDNGIQYQGYFTAGNSKDAARYNIWFIKNGKRVWHGFFEDYMGGLVIVIDDVVDLGDGGGPTDNASGSVWFKNFGLTYAPHPPTYCWFVSLGPYDCRAWPTKKEVETTRAIYPDFGYKKLGTFTGLSLAESFNDSL